VGYDKLREACVVFFDGGRTPAIVRLCADYLRREMQL
jgi:hypothetical protein